MRKRKDWPRWRRSCHSAPGNIVPRGIAGAALLLLLAFLVIAGQQGTARATASKPPDPVSARLAQQMQARALDQAEQHDSRAAKTAKTAKTAQPSASAAHRSAAAAHRAHEVRKAASATRGQIAANWALRQLGKPYRWAGAGPDAFDCSGLAMRAWQQAGIYLAHFTGAQWTSGPHIRLDQLRRGDLVFFAYNTRKPATIHHVGIYIGGGKMVDAPNSGERVHIETIHEPGLIGATRPE